MEMSGLINNREHRQQVLKELINELGNGKSVDEVRARFMETFQDVSASEISEVEQALISEGMPVAEVQRLCDVHASVFKGSIEEIHRPQSMPMEAGHPVQTFMEENRAIERVIDTLIRPSLPTYLQGSDGKAGQFLKQGFELLTQVDRHYLRKENLLFPYLERYSVTAPPKVMWGVDDEIRALLKQTRVALEVSDHAAFMILAEDTLNRIAEMIFKEEKILLPMALEKLSADEWRSIQEQSGENGYCLIGEPPAWKTAAQATPEALTLPSGSFTMDELVGMLNTLPFDITFVDKDDKVKYYSQGPERIFMRANAILGRKVSACHPPASVHIVEKIVEDFKSGRKDHEDFWLKMGEQLVYIRYFAVRGEGGQYLGTLEVTQDIAPVQAITGEKRLMSE